jgi:hypothetical protein
MPSGPAKHVAIQGAIPIVLTAIGTTLAVTTKPTPSTIRKLHNLAAGMLLATVSADLYPDMVNRALEGPASKLGTATGFMLAALVTVIVYEVRENIQHPSVERKRDATIFRSNVEAAVLGFITGSVLFERRLDTVSVPYMIAAGTGAKALIGTIVSAQIHDPDDPYSTEYRVSEGLSHMCALAGFFALALAIVPVTARSVRPLYAMIMAFVTIQSTTLAINDIASAGNDESLGLSVRDYGEAAMFFVGEALVLSTRWIVSTVSSGDRLARRGGPGRQPLRPLPTPRRPG